MNRKYYHEKKAIFGFVKGNANQIHGEFIDRDKLQRLCNTFPDLFLFDRCPLL